MSDRSRRLENEILFLAQELHRPHKCQICRTLNDRPLHYCGDKSCFANSRKRAKGIGQPHNCRVPLQTLAGAMRRLEKRGLLFSRREKKADGDELRCWDYFSVVYSTGLYWIGRGENPDRRIDLA